jgi:hypothetical protein
MANRLQTFKNRDITRVIKAARAAGVDVKAVTVDPHTGKITVAQDGSGEPNDLDSWLKKKDAHPA